jgi:hypothetical protein
VHHLAGIPSASSSWSIPRRPRAVLAGKLMSE